MSTHTTNQQLVTVNLDWQRAAPKAAHEFVAVTDAGDVFKAFRHRTDYGWSWFSITKNGQPSTINSGRQTELPGSIQEWRDVVAAVRPSTCPGCSGSGVLSDDPQVLKCTSCGGIFTDAELPITLDQARKIVALDQPMKQEAGLLGQFYFDLDVLDAILADGTVNRIHGWADRETKRVVQWG